MGSIRVLDPSFASRLPRSAHRALAIHDRDGISGKGCNSEFYVQFNVADLQVNRLYMAYYSEKRVAPSPAAPESTTPAADGRGATTPMPPSRTEQLGERTTHTRGPHRALRRHECT